ncbi:hypothetical protein NEISICOT_01809 [Neisseria sicca ATCC 29256]|uniref:Uncharacterized protein n=2 Tax=Neisseria TaxID=482 RepID=A0AA36XKY8_9NEIS|nr:hypothetical protein NEISICOT_01809 [Neisseria sicca ATCC 29256]EGQ77113.1 hypothetical protein HMPREF9418_1339 [Neisseria macacae ATCC 33926]
MPHYIADSNKKDTAQYRPTLFNPLFQTTSRCVRSKTKSLPE